MKRPLEDVAHAAVDVRAAVAATFKPEQKRRAGDVCKNASDCAGYIEGKVYDKGAASEDSWEFLLTVELGSRAYVVLSGSISRWFRSLPIAVGAQVRLDLKGVVVEDLPSDKIRPLILRKRFVWREGVAIYVHNPKTGEEAFFDTWKPVDTRPTTPFPASSPGPADPQSSTTSSIPKKRKVTPPLTPSTTHEDVQSSPSVTRGSPPVTERPPIALSERQDVSQPPPPGHSLGGPSSIADTSPQSSKPSDDSQNPQSLPSPPPELATDTDTKIDSNRTTAGEEVSASLAQAQCDTAVTATTGKPESSSRPDAVTHQPSEPARAPIREVEPEARQQPAAPNTDLSRPAKRRPSTPPVEAKRKKRWISTRDLRKKDARKLKQLRKRFASAGDAHQDGEQPQAGSRGSGDDEEDFEEDYWEAVDSIPDDVLRRVGTEELDENPEDDARGPEDDPHGQPREPGHENPPPLSEAGSRPEAEPLPKLELASQAVPAREPSPPPPSQSSSQENVSLTEALRAGCHTAFGSAYTPLLEFGGQGIRNIMGVVASPPSTIQTKTGEFMMRLNLFDQSNIATNGLNVALFDKDDLALPRADVGDVLLLRTVMVDQFNGACAVGPSYKGWQWAVFHVKTGRLSSAPEDTCALRHFQPERSELHHSLRLGDWWRDISANQVAFVGNNSSSVSGNRSHKLFSEADCNGFFDCTVEVLHGYQAGESVYTLFVTDYTRNPSAVPIRANWCPPKLAEVALQIEMWDSSAEVGPTMQPGEYYLMRNMRLRISGGGYLEGKMKEGRKIKKLDEDVLENQPHLIELLKRKQEWEARAGTVDGIPEFPHQLMAEVETDHHFNCTVEVVYISAKDGFTYLYVTDYTARPDLVPVSAAIASGALAERVVRISLNDEQIEIGKSLEVGDFIAIRNLRLRASNGGTFLSGRLGGHQRLITKLNPKSTANIELRELLRRKKEFQVSQEKPKDSKKSGRASRRAIAAAEAPTALEKEPRSRSRAKDEGKAAGQYVTLDEVEAAEACPAVFHVRAKVVDFFPDDLRNCTVMRCTNCNHNIPKTRQRCTECDDAMEDTTFVQAFFNLYFCIADEEGTTLHVSVSDERCSILHDLVPEDVHEDVDDAFAMFVARLQPLLGDLLDTSNGQARRRPNGENGPMLSLTLGSWLPEGEPETPDSRAYIVLRHAVCE